MARCVIDAGAEAFLDIYDIETGDDFDARLLDEVRACDELLVLLTPFSARRAWVFTEIGAAWGQGKRISAVLYGLSLKDLDDDNAGGAGPLRARHVRDLNDFDQYLRELAKRCDDGS
jgi:hypothetical protein